MRIYLALVLIFAASSAVAQVCQVADPTGTELNIRTAPNAKIIATRPNGGSVRLLQTVTGPDGKAWSFIAEAANGTAIGWAFRSYLRCR